MTPHFIFKMSEFQIVWVQRDAKIHSKGSIAKIQNKVRQMMNGAIVVVSSAKAGRGIPHSDP